MTTTALRAGSPANETLLRGAGLFALMVGTFIATYTFSSVNVALPYIATGLHASPAQLQLVMGVYATCFALLLIIGGRLGDTHGRARLFTAGLVLFVLASAAAGAAPGIGALIGFRALQGFAAALLVPQILATIQATTAGARRLRAVGLFSTFGGLGTACGQVIGGLLLQQNLGGTGWRDVLWFSGVLALVALPGALRLPHTAATRAGIDLPGAVLIAVSVTALLLPLTVGPSQHWPLWTIVLLVLCPVALVLFWRREHRVEGRGGLPLVPPSVLAHRAIRIGLTMAALFFAGFGAFMYEFALTSQRGLHYTPFESGMSLALFCVAYAAVSANLSRIRALIGDRLILVGVLGMPIGLLGTAAVVVTGWPHPSQLLLQPALLILGAAQALVFGPLVSAVLAEVPVRIAGLSGGLFTTVQQASLAFGVAAYGSGYAALSAGVSVPVAFGVCVAVQAVTCVGLVVLARALGRTPAAERR